MTKVGRIGGLIVGCPSCGCWVDEAAATSARGLGQPLRCPQCGNPVAWPSLRDAAPAARPVLPCSALDHDRGAPEAALQPLPVARPRFPDWRRPLRRVAAHRATQARDSALRPRDHCGPTDFTRPS